MFIFPCSFFPLILKGFSLGIKESFFYFLISHMGSIAFLGPNGTFSEEVAKKVASKFYANELIPKRNFDEVIKSVLAGEVEYGILPLENTIKGNINPNFIHLASNKISIVGESILHIHQALLGLPGTNIGDVKMVYSHNAALKQSENFTSEHKMQTIEQESTAAAMKYVAEQKNKTFAAIGNAAGAEQYGLQVLQNEIETDANNYTRFVVVQKQKESLTSDTPGKATLSFKVSDGAGKLYQIIHIISDQFKINFKKLEAINIHPEGEPDWRFFADIVIDDYEKYQQMLARLEQTESCECTVLGEYSEDQQGRDIIHKSRENEIVSFSSSVVQGKYSPEKGKASVSLKLADKSGKLSGVLGLIKTAEINLTKLVSKPLLGDPFHYQIELEMDLTHQEQYDNIMKRIKTHLSENSGNDLQGIEIFHEVA